MLPALLPALMTAGNIGVAYQGSKLILQGVEEITSIPVHTVADCFLQTIIDDCKDTFKNVAGPVVAGMEGAASLLTSSNLPRDPAVVGASAIELPTVKALREADSKRKESAQVSRRRHARAAGYMTGSREQVEMANMARAGQRLAHLSRVLEHRSRKAATTVSGSASALSAANMVNHKNYALAALDAAEASLNPPTDPRDVLASEEVSGQEKSSITYIIDAINRDQEPDYEVLADRYVMANSYDGPTDVADTTDTAGHDHGGACHCGGSCGSCKAALGKSSAALDASSVGDGWADDEVEAAPLPAPHSHAPAPVAGPAETGWDDDDKSPTLVAGVQEVVGQWSDDDVPAEDLSFKGSVESLPVAHWMDPQLQGCTTGCNVPVPRRRR